VVDAAVDQMIHWAAAIGAGRPDLALRVIAEMYRDRDWESDDVPQIKAIVDDIGEAWGATGADPVDEIAPSRFAAIGTSMRPEELKDKRTWYVLEHFCLNGILWGLAYPDAFAAWYEANATPPQEKWQPAGLSDREPPQLTQFYADCVSLLEDYQAEIAPLPSIPSRLLDDAQALGRRVDDPSSV
jgi:hypothetical protein